MKRYNNFLYEDKEGGWVMFEDVKITAIMNFNLLDQIRELQMIEEGLRESIKHQREMIEELEQKISRRDTIIKLYERDL